MATLIVTVVYDVNEAPKVYEKLFALVELAPTTSEDLHAADDAAVSDYLVTYMNADAARLCYYHQHVDTAGQCCRC